MDDLAPAFTPAILGVRVPRFKSEAAELRTFWFKPDQHLWLVKLNDAYGSSLCIGHVIQPDPPTTLMLAVAETPSRSSLPSNEGGYVVPAASDPNVTSRAGAGGATADGTAGLIYGSHI